MCLLLQKQLWQPKDVRSKDLPSQAWQTAELQTDEPQAEEWTPTVQNPLSFELAKEAYHGLAGQFVEEAVRESEASPVAVLLTFLARFGCEFFNPHTLCPYYEIGDTKHYPRLFVAICGQTAKARKGTSAKPVERIFDFPPQTFPQNIQVSPGPLSSGEGLIYAVRDKRTELDPVSGEVKLVDIGAADKRLFVLDEELAGALTVTKKEGNTLSSVLRGFWDSGSARPMTKTNRICSTRAHVCIVAHITKGELETHLQNVELLNGFANRFLWALVHRSKLVSIPKAIPDSILQKLQFSLIESLRYGQQCKNLVFAEATKELWTEIYPWLSRDKAGMAGAVTDRAEPQTARLALIYALLDKKDTVEPVHLQSALAVWNYCEESAKSLFGGRGIFKLDDKIFSYLESETLTLTQISTKLGRNVQSKEIKSALQRLIDSGIVKFYTEKTKGRPITIFSAVQSKFTK